MSEDRRPIKLGEVFANIQLGAEEGTQVLARGISDFLRDCAYEGHSPPGLKKKTESLACWVFAQNHIDGLEICEALIQKTSHLDSTKDFERWAFWVGYAKAFLEKLRDGGYKH